MSSPEQHHQATLEEYLDSALFTEEIPDTASEEDKRENKKAILRRKCVLIGTEMGFQESQGRLLAMYFLKLIDKDPANAGKFWEELYKLHYFATDAKKAEEHFINLSGLTKEGGLSYLWTLVYGIVRGDWEVLQGDVTPTERCYFLYYRQDYEEQYKNQKRHQTLKALKPFVDGSIVEKPLVGLRSQDLAGLSEQETTIFREIIKKIEKHLDIMLCARVESEDIFEYFELVKSTLNKIINDLNCADKTKAKYKVFIDAVVAKHISKLFDYAVEMNKKENDNPFVRDIINEAFVIYNESADKDFKAVSPVKKLMTEWEVFKTALISANDNKGQFADTMFVDPATKKGLDQTVLFTGLTPVEGTRTESSPKLRGAVSSKPTMIGLAGINPDNGRTFTPMKTKIGIATTPVSMKVAKILKETQPDLPVQNEPAAQPVIAGVQAIFEAELSRYSAPIPPVKSITNGDIELYHPGTIIQYGSKLEKKKIPEVREMVRKVFTSGLRLHEKEGVDKLIQQLKKIQTHAANEEIRKAFIDAVLYQLRIKTEDKIPEISLDDLYGAIRQYLNELISGDKRSISCTFPEYSKIVELINGIPSLENYPKLTELLKRKGLYEEAEQNQRIIRHLLLNGVQSLQIHIQLQKLIEGAIEPRTAFETFKVNIENQMSRILAFRKKARPNFLKRLFGDKELTKEITDYFDKTDESINNFWIEALSPTVNNFKFAYFYTQSE